MAERGGGNGIDDAGFGRGATAGAATGLGLGSAGVVGTVVTSWLLVSVDVSLEESEDTSGAGPVAVDESSSSTSCTVRTTSSMPTCDLTR